MTIHFAFGSFRWLFDYLKLFVRNICFMQCIRSSDLLMPSYVVDVRGVPKSVAWVNVWEKVLPICAYLWLFMFICGNLWFCLQPWLLPTCLACWLSCHMKIRSSELLFRSCHLLHGWRQWAGLVGSDWFRAVPVQHHGCQKSNCESQTGRDRYSWNSFTIVAWHGDWWGWRNHIRGFSNQGGSYQFGFFNIGLVLQWNQKATPTPAKGCICAKFFAERGLVPRQNGAHHPLWSRRNARSVETHLSWYWVGLH